MLPFSLIRSCLGQTCLDIRASAQSQSESRLVYKQFSNPLRRYQVDAAQHSGSHPCFGYLLACSTDY